MKRLLALAAVCAFAIASTGASCLPPIEPPDPPPPQCEGPAPCPEARCEGGQWVGCPPPAPVTKYDELRLDRFGTTVVDAVGAPFNFRGYASCCFWEPGKEPLPDWSLDSKEHIKYLHDLGYNVLHWRLGPWNVLPDFPDAIKIIGGPYIVEGGKADLTRWNEAFWRHVYDLADYAGSLGMRVEIDVVDGWGCKPGGGVSHPGYHPWKAENNLQGEDWATTCGTLEIVAGGVHDRWARKAFETLVMLSNVYFQDGNEINLVRSYSVAWTASIGNILRDVERQKGAKRRLFASNAPAAANIPQVDLVNVHHNEAPTEADRRGSGKPVLNNEYNPSPAFTPQQVKSRHCDAKQNGTYFWHWRHEQTFEQFKATAELLAQPCPTLPPDHPELKIPQGVGWVLSDPQPPHDPAITQVVNEAIAVVLPHCTIGQPFCLPGMPAQDFFAAVARQVRTRGTHYAGQHEDGHSDAIMVGTTKDQNWEQHIYSFADQSVVWDSQKFHYRAPGPLSCIPPPALGIVVLTNAGVNRVVIDATPKTCANKPGGDAEWNARCSTGNTCSPGGTEANPGQRTEVERLWGPWTWTVAGAPCPACFLDGGNPLRLVAPGQEGKTIRLTGGNAVFAEIMGAHP